MELAWLEWEQYTDDIIKYKVLNINSPAILKRNLKLANKLTYLSERISNSTIDDDLNIIIEKDISLIFSLKVLREHHSIIADEIDDILATIGYEIHLITQEADLRMPEILKVVTLTASKKEYNNRTCWQLNSDQCKCEQTGDDPIEYWGHQWNPIGHSMVEWDKYPWMTVKISDIYPSLFDDFGLE